ncbi:NBR1-Ig-like domain-containing protein [Tessaracoccus sp. Y1736]
MAATPDEPDCAPDAALAGHLSAPDGTQLPVDTTFDKSWRLVNTGCGSWPEGTELIHLDGDLSPAGPTPTVRPIVPGGTADITVSVTTPGEPGDHRGAWQLRAPDGRQFGTILTSEIVTVADSTGTGTVLVPLQPIPVFPSILVPQGFPSAGATPTANASGSTPSADADEVRRAVSLRVDLTVIDRNTFSSDKTKELIFIEPDIVLTSLRPTDSYTHELCAGGETSVKVVTELSLVDHVVNARSAATLSVGSSCVTGTPRDTRVYNLVAGDGQTVATSGWGSVSGGAYDIALSLANEPWQR